jgi:hypothetical protein
LKLEEILPPFRKALAHIGKAFSSIIVDTPKGFVIFTGFKRQNTKAQVLKVVRVHLEQKP